MAKINLSPCPFCGGEAHFDRDESTNWEWIECSECHVATNSSVSAMEDCKPILAESWNMRSLSTSIPTRKARIEEAARLNMAQIINHLIYPAEDILEVLREKADFARLAAEALIDEIDRRYPE